jgi:hypothetical protein
MHSEQFAAVLLVAIGAIYIGFGLQTGKSSQILVEVMAALGFFGAVLAGLWFTPWIAFGIARIIKDRGSLPYFYGIRSFAPVTTGPRREAWW